MIARNKMKSNRSVLTFLICATLGACVGDPNDARSEDQDAIIDAPDLVDSLEQKSDAEALQDIDDSEAAAGQTFAARPSCVTVRHTVGTFTQKVEVCNSCSGTVSFVVRRVGLDSPCTHVNPGRCSSWRWANGFNYQGTSFGCD